MLLLYQLHFITLLINNEVKQEQMILKKHT